MKRSGSWMVVGLAGLALILSGAITPVEAHLFTLKDPAARSVSVAGEFNNWNPNANPLKGPDANGVWSLELQMRPGSYQYKFVVNGSDWKIDPANSNKSADGLGGENSVVTVAAGGTPAAPAAPAATSAGGTVFSVEAPGARLVEVMGAWNEWSSPTVCVLGADGKWTASINLRPGTYEYKFRKDGDWDALNKDNRSITVAAGAAPAAPMAAAAAPAVGGALFTFHAPTARSVSVAGEFNNWNATATPLSGPDANGKWTASPNLRPGRYMYKYVVNGSDWKADPNNPNNADDGMGGQNSVITVTASAPTASAAPTAAPAAGGALFTFHAPTARSVSVAGEFNNWNATATPLSGPDANGNWTASPNLRPGRYMYKYVVNGSDWKADPNNPNNADDGMGGQNSVITVTASAPTASAAPATPATPAAPAAAPRAGTRFLYLGDANTRSVAVAGAFNNWSTSSHRLSNPKGDGVWIGEFPIPAGIYEYKFVINATEWKADPNNPKKKDDGMGGENSILEVSMSSPPGSGVSPPIGARDRPVASIATSASATDLWAHEPLHRFAYRPSAGVTSVAVAGSFNNWSTTAHPLTDADGDGLWTLELNLPDGRSSYKYVENGTKWIPDPANPLSDPDGVGGKNSIVVRGGEDAVSGEARRGDGKIEAAAIRHRPDARFVTRAGETLLIVTLRIARNDVDGVDLIVNGQDVHHLELLTHDRNHEYWRGSAAISRESVSYHFILKDGVERLRLSRTGLAREGEGRAFEIGPGPAFVTPDWTRAAILYQVFPDRFANGNPENDPKGPDLRPWKHEPLLKDPTGWNARYGGDLEGLLVRSNYLTELGVTGIKLNPILTAPSAAKYDVTDYENVDPEFGGNQAFEALLNQQNFHIVVDGVFNHSGEKHPFFRDAVARGPASPKYTWYNFLKWPLPDRLEGRGANAPSNYYECWWGFGGLPAWNTRNPEVREYLMGSAEKWTRAGVDGWRLDAANEVEHEFWIEFRERMRRINPEVWIAGEIWEIALEWLLGDQFDAVTNYPLRGAILDFFVEEKIDAEQFADRIAALTVAVPPQVLSVQYNHLSSHDVPRIMTIARGDAGKAMQAATFQFVRPGVPVIYYGDEIGMEGGEDPDNRRVFPWDERGLWNESMHRRYRELIGLRRRISTLAASTWRPLHAKGRLLVVATKDEAGTLVMAFNASGSASEPIEVRLPADLAAGAAAGGQAVPPAPRMALFGGAARFTEILTGGALESSEIVMTIPAIEARGSRFYFAAKSE